MGENIKLVALYHRYGSQNPNLVFLTGLLGQDTLKDTNEIEILPQKANDFTRLESLITDRVGGAVRGCFQEIRSDIMDAISVGFTTVLGATVIGGSCGSGPPQSRVYPHPSLLASLRQFLSNPHTTWKTAEQAEALEVSINRKEHLLLIGPTAMGKSLIYMLPAALFDSKLVTLVLLPLSSLHLDFEHRCKDQRIKSARWRPNETVPSNASIIYISPEHAQTKEFLNYATSLHLTGKLVRFVIDEPHLAVQHASFRYCFAFLKPLVTSRELFSILPFLLPSLTR